MHAPRILATIEDHALPVLPDTGADLSVMSKAQMDLLGTPLDNTTPRRVHGFGGNSVNLTGPRHLRLHLWCYYSASFLRCGPRVTSHNLSLIHI